MDIDEFLKTEPPGMRRSRLLPYAREIAVLKAEGYTNEQVGKWLAANGVQISTEGVRYFVKHHLPTPPRLGIEAPGTQPVALADSAGGHPPGNSDQGMPHPRRRGTAPAADSAGTAAASVSKRGNPLAIKKQDFDIADFDKEE